MTRNTNAQGEGAMHYNQFVNSPRGPGQFNMQGMPNHGHANGLPRLATNGLHSMNLAEGSLRTAPPVGAMNGNFPFNMGQLGSSTINPAQLHMGESPDHDAFGPMDTAMIDNNDNYEWMRNFQNQYQNGNEHALQSPSIMSHGGDINMHGNERFGSPQDHPMMWQRHASISGPFPDPMPQDVPMHLGSISPHHNFHNQSNGDGFFHARHNMPMLNSHSSMNGYPSQMPHQTMYNSDATSASSMFGGSSGRHSSVTSVSTETITDVTRSALLMSLSQPQQLAHGSRKFSQPAVSSPLRETMNGQFPTANLPKTTDLRRFVDAYIQYFHPHFPFLHIGTLSFDTPAYTNHLRPAMTPGGMNYAPQQVIGGGGCLVLAMAAIGALYEHDQPAAKELFDAAKKMIQLYLEERRKADSKASPAEPRSNTPLWLVQAMLLNVIYGHNCDDKVSGDIAETHCAALISLARSAGLLAPLPESSIGTQYFQDGHRLSPIREIPGSEAITLNNPFGMGVSVPDENHQWHRWVIVEERKRALYAIFHMSSLLVASYNHPPALMNSAVEHDLPCEEALWSAESASAWMALGGSHAARQSAVPFASALGMLLNASRSHGDPQNHPHSHAFGSGIPVQDLPPSPLKPSTFGCLALIDALHNYIWETRQRHSGRQWTTQETESMHAHIEPALRAWQSAWATNPTHTLERPNPHGMGPLSADCIPLLDLAYVRLFVSFGTAKECFWQRDFDAMAEELARGSDFLQHADHSEANSEGHNTGDVSRNSPELNGPPRSLRQQATGGQGQTSKRERQLRKAAFYAADSLSMADKLNVTFADFTSRELPLQSALCTFDCAQILAEWVSTVQERVGRYIGVLGRDHIDFHNVPAIMLLEEEDCKLLEKIADILQKAETKMTYAISNMQGSDAMSAMHKLPSVTNKGFGSKILFVTAHMFERNEIWPGMPCSS